MDLAAETLALRARYDEEPSHSDQVTKLALLLFDGLRGWHGFDARARELMHAAALLHDIGWSQVADGRGHHKWSARLIRDHGWKNLARGEVEIVAQTARYHRKSPPRDDHAEFEALSSDDRRRVLVLGGILRLADALDRTHTQRVRGVETVVTPEKIIVRAAVGGPWEEEAAMFAAKKDMLERAAERPVVCEELPQKPTAPPRR
jgi:exopolyphosphatase/guanosine-5'-triphosphate,3'-diphosphate pyrophosphatase